LRDKELRKAFLFDAFREVVFHRIGSRKSSPSSAQAAFVKRQPESAAPK
jgi:hypothetical protein